MIKGSKTTLTFSGKPGGILTCDNEVTRKYTALIFGVTGQDGSYLAERLLNLGHIVYGVARRTSNGNTFRLSKILEHENFYLLSGDITDFASILSILNKSKPHRIYNLAAQSHVGTSFEQSSSSLDITAKGCVNILEAIRLYRSFLPKDLRMYQASSSEMFGDSFDKRTTNKLVGRGMFDGCPIYIDEYGKYTAWGGNEIKYQDENTLFNPQSPYAIAKLTAHNYCGLYRNAYGLDVRCGILFNHESERRGEEFVTRKITKYLAKLHHHIKESHNKYYTGADELKDMVDNVWHSIDHVCDPRVERKILDSAPRLKLGNIESSRDWGHAEDYVRAMILIMEADEPKDYVVATGETHTIKEFLRDAFKFAACGDWHKYVDFDDSLKRPCEVPFLKGDASKIKDELGWEPEIKFDDLVARMVTHDIDSYARINNVSR